MMRRQSLYPSISILVILLLVLVLLPRSGTSAVIEQLIAVIDGEPYTLSNLDRYAKVKLGRGFPSGDLNPINAADRQVLEQFVTDKLLEAEVVKAGIRVGPEQVEHYIEQVKRNNHLSDEQLATALKREGQTPESYRASVKTELEKSEIISREVRRKVNITDDDVERYYKLHAQDYRAKERAHLQHILLTLTEKAPTEQVQSVSEQARGIYQRIQAGEDFGKLAEEYSDGAGRANGGDIGWVVRGTLIAGIDEFAFEKLQVGGISEPFRTSMGIHIVKLVARDPGIIPPLASVAPRIRDELLRKALEERFARWLKTDIRRKHQVEIKIAGVVFKPEDAKDSTMNDLVAQSMRSKHKEEERSALSYLNPFSYIVKETPIEEEDPNSPLAGKNVVSVFGVPLFTNDAVDDTPEVLTPPEEDSDKGGFSVFLDSMNPFSSKDP